MTSAIPSFNLCTTADSGFVPVLICDDGTQIELPPHSAAELLLAAAEIDLTAYTDAVRHLRETHPLFEEKLDISVLEYRGFLSQALELPKQLRRTDPVGWLDACVHLRASLQQPDDGSASFLLYSGQRILQAIERPVLLQVRLRNIFEMIFDNMDISTPHRQWEYLRTVYPDVAQQCDPIHLKEVTEPFRFSAVNGWNYYLTILSLYFAQEAQRITRCVHCWEYFIPPTRKRTLYCDRSYDGQTCKRRGANLMRHERDEQDEALFIYRQLHVFPQDPCQAGCLIVSPLRKLLFMQRYRYHYVRRYAADKISQIFSHFFSEEFRVFLSSLVFKTVYGRCGRRIFIQCSGAIKHMLFLAAVAAEFSVVPYLFATFHTPGWSYHAKLRKTFQADLLSERFYDTVTHRTSRREQQLP